MEGKSIIALFVRHPLMKDLVKIDVSPSWDDPYGMHLHFDTRTPVSQLSHDEKAIMYYFGKQMENSKDMYEKELSQILLDITKYKKVTLDDISDIIDKI